MQAASARARQGQYLRFREGQFLLLSFSSDFAVPVTLSRMRGADDHAALVVGIVVVIAAVAIHIVEIVVVISGPQPPPRGAGRAQKLTCAADRDHCRFL